jgi:hypothetical protein
MIPQYHLVEGQKDSEGRTVTPSNFDEMSDEAGWFSGEPPRSYRPSISTSFQLNFEMRHYNQESREFLDFPKGVVPVTVRPGERKQE